MSAPRLYDFQATDSKRRLDSLESKIHELERQLREAKQDADRFRFKTEMELRGQKDNLLLLVFVIVNAVVLAPLFLGRH